MVAFNIVASFPSNELNTPHSILVLSSATLLVLILLLLMRARSVVIGIFIGAIAFGCVSWFLFWPQVLREPRAPNPGPFAVFVGAVLGSISGFTSAVIGKLLHRVLSHIWGSRNLVNDHDTASNHPEPHE